MRSKQLGRTDIVVPEICLGSMTWGTQNSIEEGHHQIAMALAHGVNFIDTAEMYPVNPVRGETIGRTERIIGQWLEREGGRDRMIIATKHSGEGLRVVRDGARISSATIPLAVEASLRRLKTDYIDLYQFHWPNRGSYMFRKNWRFDPSSQNTSETLAEIEDCLGALQDEVAKGRIRAFGLSNESAWGTAQYLRIAEAAGLPRAATIQNEYSLLCRLFDTDLAELCVNEDVGLLAYSPLAAGLLTGKYQNGAIPAGSRMSINADLGGRRTVNAFRAVEVYQRIAERHGLNVVQMALAFCMSRPFMTSTIIGATTEAQLQLALDAPSVTLSKEILKEIDTAHRAHPMPF